MTTDQIRQRTTSATTGHHRTGTARGRLHRWSSGLALGLALLAAPVAAQADSLPAGPLPPVAVTVTFTHGAHLVTEPRLAPAADPARASLLALLAGPVTAGDTTEVPAGTRLLGLALRDGTATVNLSPALQLEDGDPAIPLCLAQLVDTLTQFPTVQRVALEVDGQPLSTLGGEGLAVPPVLNRATVARLLANPSRQPRGGMGRRP